MPELGESNPLNEEGKTPELRDQELVERKRNLEEALDTLNPKDPSSESRESTHGLKERALSFLRYKTLKVRQYFNLLDQEGHDEILSVDFQDELKDNHPIERVFSPEEELVKIKSLLEEEAKNLILDLTK